MNDFNFWLNNSDNDPLTWIWLKLNNIRKNENSDKFIVNYNKYILEKDLNDKIQHDFSSPIESLYNDLHCERMPFNIIGEFETLIDNLSLKRKDILNIMKFVIDKSDLYSVEMIEILIKKFPFSNNKIQLSIIYCISDILYNSHSSRAGAWKLRNCIMNLFPYLVSHISFNSNLNNKLDLNLIKETRNIIDLWLEWNIFSISYIKGITSSLYFDKKLSIMKKNTGNKLLTDSKYPELDGKLLNDEILSVISIWPIESRIYTWRHWLEINNSIKKKNFHESKLRQDWILNNGIIVPPMIKKGLSNFLHRISYLFVFDYLN